MLSSDQLNKYFEDGYVIVDNLLSEQDIFPIEGHVHTIIDEITEILLKNGRIDKRNCQFDGDISQRMSNLESICPGSALLATLRRRIGIEVFKLWFDSKLLEIVEQIIGPDIDGHPFWSLRAKVPKNELLVVPWHQDCAYLSSGAESTTLLTIWIPLVDATIENGCLEVARGMHKQNVVFDHVPQSKRLGHEESWYLEMDEHIIALEDRKICEVAKGGIILFNQLLPHRSTKNTSDQTRWSLDLRYLAGNAFNGHRQPSIPFKRADQRLKDWIDTQKQEFLINNHGYVDYITKQGELASTHWLDRWGK